MIGKTRNTVNGWLNRTVIPEYAVLTLEALEHRHTTGNTQNAVFTGQIITGQIEYKSERLKKVPVYWNGELNKLGIAACLDLRVEQINTIRFSAITSAVVVNEHYDLIVKF